MLIKLNILKIKNILLKDFTKFDILLLILLKMLRLITF